MLRPIGKSEIHSYGSTSVAEDDIHLLPISTGDAREGITHSVTNRSITIHARPDDRALPRSLLAELDAADLFEVSFNDRDTWHYASVEGTGVCGDALVVSAVLRHDYFAPGEAPLTPFVATDQFDIIVPWEDGAWGDPVAYERIPDDEAMATAVANVFKFGHREVGAATVRPTTLTDAQYDWEFWADRPTDPQDLHHDYWVEGIGTEALADQHGVSDWTIRNWMDRAGIPRRLGAAEQSQRTNDP